MEPKAEPVKQNRISLTAGLIVITILVTAVTLGATSIWSYYHQQAQELDQMLTEARLLDKAVFAAWDFVGNQEARINTDADGSYNFKGIYCSLVGKSVGKLFSLSTGSLYQLSYIRDNPRSQQDAPDEFETEALSAIYSGESDEFYGVDESENGVSQFRYVRAIRLTEDCLDCHGKPAGEIDITGFEKEGMELGDIGGAVSISMPMSMREAKLQSNMMRNIAFTILIVALVVAVFVFFSRRFVIVPLNKLKSATAEIGKGNLEVDLKGIRATSEVDELVHHIQMMSEELSDLYNNLEEKINEKTVQYQEANELLTAKQKEVAQINALLSQANERLQEENEYRADFLSVVSHELRTPLTAIMSFTELWEKSPEESIQNNKEYVDKIKTYSLSLLHMVNNTLDMAHLDAGKAELASEDVDFVDLIREVEFVAMPLAQAKEVSLTTKIDQDVPLIRSDWEQIHKIIMNLVSNAIKFTDEGGKVDVHISLGDVNNTIAIKVKDNGIGIDDERLGSIFERFRQVDSTMSRKYGGTGLGLAIVREVTTLLGGEVLVTSTLGEGSEFTIILPFKDDERYQI